MLLLFSILISITIIKFGLPASLPEAFNFPLNSAEWLIFTWPAALFTLLSSFLLLLNLLPGKQNKKSLSKNHLLINILWFLLTLASLLGFINTTCSDFPVLQCFYIFGLFIFSLSLSLFFKKYSYNDTVEFLLGAVFWTTIIIAVYGLYQYFIGFSETRTYIYSALQNKDIKLDRRLYTRLNQNYVFSTFALTNTLAGYIILTMPMCVWYAYKANVKLLSYCNGKKKLSQLKFLLPSIIFTLLFSVLILTGSRSALLALCIASIIFFLFYSRSVATKIIIASTALVILIIGLFFLQIKGSLSGTIQVRLDYYYVALKLFFNNIITGSGWGSFFFQYGHLKSFPSPEAAHTPHNAFLYFFSQAGVISGILFLIAWFSPILLVFKKLLYKKQKISEKEKQTEKSSYKVNLVKYPIFYGLIAISIHMLFDVDFQIPAITCTSLLFVFIALYDNNNTQTQNYYKKTFNILCLFSLIVAFYFSFQIIQSKYYIQKLNTFCFPISNILNCNAKADKDANTYEQQLQNHLNAAVEHTPSSPLPWAIAGEKYLAEHQIYKAEICYTKAIKLSPDRASYYYKLFLAQIYQRKLTLALKNLKKAYELFPNLYKQRYIKVNEALKRQNKISIQ